MARGLGRRRRPRGPSHTWRRWLPPLVGPTPPLSWEDREEKATRLLARTRPIQAGLSFNAWFPEPWLDGRDGQENRLHGMDALKEFEYLG